MTRTPHADKAGQKFRSAPKKKVKGPYAEQAFDRMVNIIDGPANRVVERVMKNKIVLTPLAAVMTMQCRMYLALRDRNPGALIGRYRGADSKGGL